MASPARSPAPIASSTWLDFTFPDEQAEPALRRVRDDAGERRLSRTGWPPENHRGNLVGLDEFAEGGFRAGEVILAEDGVEGLRSDPFRQRLGGGGLCLKEVAGAH